MPVDTAIQRRSLQHSFRLANRFEADSSDTVSLTDRTPRVIDVGTVANFDRGKPTKLRNAITSEGDSYRPLMKRRRRLAGDLVELPQRDRIRTDERG